MAEYGSAGSMSEESKLRREGGYGGGMYEVEQHIVESLGGTKGFNRDKPKGRLASTSPGSRVSEAKGTQR